ncbi:MAG: aminoacyl-histidine dipeptidase [Myxococcales bacterium]|nr:aminoacyl-histidine dipeptidase [Myxococcales bacterium]
MSSPLDSLQPRLVWHHFDAIRRTPRPSKKEERIRRHVLDWASEKGYAARVDAIGNVLVSVPAKGGLDDRPLLVLQAHLDMVCEKNRDTVFDFDAQAIEVAVVDGWVRAKGTTLGADNGIGVALAMALADDAEAVHPPLELLFTIDEETGLTGATELDPSLVRGRRLLNLDSEEWGIFYIGCAGGGDDHLRLVLDRLSTSEIPEAVALQLAVRGGRGGHSGCDIHENRANAVKLLVRWIGAARQLHTLQIASIDGGDKHNAIPREAEATLIVSASELESVRDALAVAEEGLKVEFGKWEPSLQFQSVDVPLPAETFGAAASDRLLQMLLALPNGVQTMSRDIAGLVETSTNLAAVHTIRGAVTVLTSSRSSLAPALLGVREQIAAVGRLVGAQIERMPGYPGWAPNTDSPLLATARRVYEAMHGQEPVVAAIHAGLECGVLGERVPGMDMLSLGPTITGPHSPDERVEIESVADCYRYLRAFVAEL